MPALAHFGDSIGHLARSEKCQLQTLPRRYPITSSARNYRWRHVSAGALAVLLAFSAVLVSIGKFPSPGSEPKRVFTSSQPAIADEILGIERRCFTASLLGARIRPGRERRAQAGIDVVIAEGLL